MNPQPFQTPPRWWPSLLSPKFIQLYARRRNRELRQQQIESIETRGAETVQAALQAGYGVLLVSNHSFHYDSYVMIEAGRRAGWYPHIMTAWQVFAMYSTFGQWMLQKHGCFSINREGSDSQAFRQAVSILKSGEHPLLIYPEGDIHHSNDRILPFREGAGAIALLAHKSASRPIVVIPCAMKCFYTADPTAELHDVMDRLESHIAWRPARGMPLLDRIYRFGNGFLSLKEVEYFGETRSGTIRERIAYLANGIITQIRERHDLPPRGNDLHQRIRYVRVHLIHEIEKLGKRSERTRRLRLRLSRQRSRQQKSNSQIETHSLQGNQVKAELNRRYERLQFDMQDLFFVTQLSSYHGDYSLENPTIERLAETIDKFEEDLFSLQAPTPRGRRRAVVQFGSPIELNSAPAVSADLSLHLERSVQLLLDSMNDKPRTERVAVLQ